MADRRVHRRSGVRGGGFGPGGYEGAMGDVSNRGGRYTFGPAYAFGPAALPRQGDYARGPRAPRGPESRHPRGEDRSWWDRAGDEVASWFGDDHAEHRRWRSVEHAGRNRGRGPADFRRSDGRIHEDVCERLTEDSRIDATDVSITVEDGVVTLDGAVEARAEKRRAEDLAEDIGGVRRVQNNLRVRAMQGASCPQDADQSAPRQPAALRP